MDFAALQRKLVLMLTLVGVSTVACAAAMFIGIRYDLPLVSGAGVVLLLAGFAAQIWFIMAFRKAKS